MNFDQHIKVNYESLSENEQEMIYYIRNHRQEVVKLSIIELGDKLLSSKSSVLRLAKKLGFRGFSDMKYAIEQSLLERAIAPTDLVAALKKEIEQTFQYAEQTNFQPLLDKIKQANQLHLYATGFTQNNYTKDFANDLFLSNRPNFLISGETNFEMISHTLSKEDLVIVTSLSGETPAIKDTIRNLELNKVPICSITSFGKSFLSEAADFQLYYETSDLPSPVVGGGSSMIGLNIILAILARKYREFVLFDE
ncbi:MurR/RpiR family transcriptional regulator [Enterococcus pallens]|uniref:Phosphosugar-binding transcriptional regulator n=1 Tax=Enterococcus pallens ATCC BAA-351 TaxID=1158607 RepID=R2TD06_9ENTE|nr:MurR/RpiR family transcriptional regulator [Enterococcus pallens]EOH98099.1 hypothetical protein UAU_00773 [Enterococcus pallens ATCC BAA-351]EOU14653.1 hypothetical protein I588_05012 [Enterococcus pallens ATCC BAA-351]